MPTFSGVAVNEKQIERLTGIFRIANDEIMSEISNATSFGIANRRQILAQIRQILGELGARVYKMTDKEITAYYKLGAREAVRQLKGASLKTRSGFNRIHRGAILALVSDTQRAFGESMTGVNRSARRVLGKATRAEILSRLAIGKAKGETLREVKKIIIATIKDEGLSALIDKGGHRWSLDRYAEMLFRTKAVEARNMGMANRMVENGFDLAQVSTHNTKHRECAVWEGKILSLTGNTLGYSTLGEAEMAGLFHPNCKHSINALVPELVLQTGDYTQNKSGIISFTG
jgi:hypothetical protein